ncbi:NUDIX hydrolase [Streptomyces sp. NPDC046203]|uniref:NUDIX hydrolase n=1 Tax=Streptomyces sp. NPDC046203 TaxID=3154602 RepID=UPI0033D2AFAE
MTGPTGPGGVIVAAGAVLWRPARAGSGGEGAGGSEDEGSGIEIALVHRPKYDDWSLPKGKLKRGETLAACARREVLEETGQSCALGTRLPVVRYPVNGRPKEVTYWTARALGGAFTPNREVDTLLWLPPAAARLRLTQPRDRDLLTSALHHAASDSRV